MNDKKQEVQRFDKMKYTLKQLYILKSIYAEENKEKDPLPNFEENFFQWLEIRQERPKSKNIFEAYFFEVFTKEEVLLIANHWVNHLLAFANYFPFNNYTRRDIKKSKGYFHSVLKGTLKDLALEPNDFQLNYFKKWLKNNL